MAIKVRCPGCRQKIRYAQAPDGRVGRCPRCSAVVLTMEFDRAPDDPDSPAASHDAVVPGPRRHTRPEEETAVFTPLFPPPIPVAAPKPLAAPMAIQPLRPAHLPARQSVLSRRRFLRVHTIGGASFSRRGHVAPYYAASAASVVGDVVYAVGFSLMVGLSLVGASVLGLWAIVILTQFP